MPDAIFYVDESGDTGWSFDHPYRRGGSSRHLTIAALEAPSPLKAYPKRLIRDLYSKHGWNRKAETKWCDMDNACRLDFAERMAAMLAKHPGLAVWSLTVFKPNVEEHIRADSNKLYNYMMRLLLVSRLKQYAESKLVIDERSIKVKSGNSLHDYLQTTLWFDEKSASKIENTQPMSSSKALPIQFADMLAGMVQSHFEDGRSAPLHVLGRHLRPARLFFPRGN